MNISKFCKLESKHALSHFLFILIYTNSSWFMFLLNISMETDTKKTLNISAISLFSSGSRPFFFPSSSYFFKHVKQTDVPFPSPNRQALIVGQSPDWHQLWFLTFLAVFSKDYKAGVIPLCVLQMFSAT